MSNLKNTLFLIIIFIGYAIFSHLSHKENIYQVKLMSELIDSYDDSFEITKMVNFKYKVTLLSKLNKDDIEAVKESLSTSIREDIPDAKEYIKKNSKECNKKELAELMNTALELTNSAENL